MNYETDDRNIKGKHYHGKGGNEEAMSQPINSPILLWWTPFTGERGRVKRCGKVECFFTIDRHFQDHPNTMVRLKTSFRIQVNDSSYIYTVYNLHC